MATLLKSDSLSLSQSTTAETMARSRQLAGLGNIAAKDGHFSEAVRRFTEAIDLYPFDHRSESPLAIECTIFDTVVVVAYIRL